MKKQLGFVLGYVALIALVGCSGSSDTLAPDQSNSATVTAVMQSVVLPMMGGMTDLDTAATAATAAAPPPGSSDDCNTLQNFCDSGTAEFCQDPGTIAWSYQACERPAGIIDGTVVVDGNFFSGTTSYDIAIGDLTLSGSVGWELENLFCRERTYEQFSAVRPNHSASINGHIRFCQGHREGQIDLLVVKPTGSFSLSLDFDAQNGTATLVGHNGTFNCTINMSNGQANCEES